MTVKHMSGWDMCEDGNSRITPVYESKNYQKQKSAISKLMGSAVAATAVVLATSLESEAAPEDDIDSGLGAEDETQTAILSPEIYDELFQFTRLMDVDSVLGFIEVASTSNGENFLGQSATSSPSQIVQNSAIADDSITQSPGVSDPAQPTQAFGNSIERIQTPNLETITVAGQSGNVTTTEGSNTVTVSGRDGIDGQDGADGKDGADGTNGRDGVDGEDGQTVFMIDPSFYENVDIIGLLQAEGIEFTTAPNGLILVSLSPDQIAELTAILSTLGEEPSEDEENNDHTTVAITGSDTDDFIVSTERGGVISGLGGNDILVAGISQDTLLGGDGNDTADYSRSGSGVNVNLADGTGAGGDAEGDQLASIENLLGSNSNDRLTGNDSNNRLFGNEGDDEIFGGAGFDSIEGGAGADFIDGGSGNTDIAEYVNSDEAVAVSLLLDFAGGGHAEGDQLDNIESLSGSLFDDILQGDNQNNRLGGLFGEDSLYGEGGNDTLIGGAEGDYLDGGEGNDTADYTSSNEGVSVSLETGEAINGDAEGDVLVSIENLAGSAHDDTLIGDDGDNRLTGRDGDDTLRGNEGNDRFVGGLGADIHDGGEGDRDAADFSAATEAVGVDLVNGGFAGEATGDTYTSIEFVVGSEYHDTILGNEAINRLTGLDGCDVLVGRGGNDTLIGGLGNDVLNGGEGDDVFIFDGQTDNDTIEDFEAGEGRTDRVRLLNEDFETFEDIQNALTQTDDGAVLTLSGGEILFQNLAIADFVADDFILG